MNTKMKVLSLALVGLCGYAGSAMATCPAGPTTANGGAWTSVNQNQGVAAIATPGYASTECRLDSSINAGAGLLASASVRWTDATVEPRVRAHFIINASAITSPVSADKVRIFGGSSTAGGAAVDFTIFGFGGNIVMNYTVHNANGTTVGGTTPLAAGENHVEYDLKTASAAAATDGYFKIWVNSNTEASPTDSKTALGNFGIGIDRFTLGLSSPSHEFVSHQATKKVGFDQFDSRRSTFIGY